MPIGSWINTGSLNTARTNQRCIVLQNGKVLAIGGDIDGTGTNTLSSCELYDPSTGLWTYTGSLNTPRSLFNAVLLNNGKVLVIGGFGSSYPFGIMTCELYDPSTELWTYTGSTITPRIAIGSSNINAVLLNDGNVLILGGQDLGAQDGACEIYNTSTGIWSHTGRIPVFDGFTYVNLILLSNGNVLAVGKGDILTVPAYSIFDINTNTWSYPLTAIPSGIPVPADFINLTELLTGDILYAGGHTLPASQTYNQLSSTWTNTGALNFPRLSCVTVTLGNGKALIVGGSNDFSIFSIFSIVTPLPQCEVYDPNTTQWIVDASLNNRRTFHTATVLPNGMVLAAGGLTNTNTLYSGVAMTSCELYIPYVPPLILNINDSFSLGEWFTSTSGHVGIWGNQ
jgi:hypothetical protein